MNLLHLCIRYWHIHCLPEYVLPKAVLGQCVGCLPVTAPTPPVATPAPLINFAACNHVLQQLAPLIKLAIVSIQPIWGLEESSGSGVSVHPLQRYTHLLRQLFLGQGI